MNYDYRIAEIIKAFLKDFEQDLEDHDHETLAMFLWDNKEDFGRMVIEDMWIFMTEEEWFKAVSDD